MNLASRLAQMERRFPPPAPGRFTQIVFSDEEEESAVRTAEAKGLEPFLIRLVPVKPVHGDSAQ